MKTSWIKPWGARVIGITGVILVTTYLGMFSLAFASPADAQSASTDGQPAIQVVSASINASEIIGATNKMRQDVGLTTLAFNSKLASSAQMKANDMATKSYFAHENPEGQRLQYWLGVVGYDYQYAGENLAVGFDSATAVMQGWRNSAGHYANIVKPEYREIGVGVASGMYQGRPVIFVVQHFGVTPELVIPVTDTVELKVKPVFTSDTTPAPVKTPEVAPQSAPVPAQPVSTAQVASRLPISLDANLIPKAYASTEATQPAGDTKSAGANALLAISFGIWLTVVSAGYIELASNQEWLKDMLNQLAKA